MFSNEMTVKRGPSALRVQSGARTCCIYAPIAAACCLVGCHGTVPQMSPITSSQPAPVVQTVTNLGGTWIGVMSPSSDGRRISVVDNSSNVPFALIRIDNSDVHGSTGKLTLCSMHEMTCAVSFSNAQLGKSAVELDAGNSISLINLSEDAGSLTVALGLGSNLLAGVLHRGSESDFRARCKA